MCAVIQNFSDLEGIMAIYTTHYIKKSSRNWEYQHIDYFWEKT